jgi:7-cyano-7-deazaguanine synthase
MNKRRAVVLLSGGLDSATALYLAKKKGFRCYCLIFDYGQRHRREVAAAKGIARGANCKWQVIKIALPWKGSSLLDKDMPLHRLVSRPVGQLANIPSTYVPGRNIIFLSLALSYAEAIGAQAIFIGAHAQDYSGYPDCRPAFYRAFAQVISAGTKAGVEKKKINIETPLLHMGKAEIIKLGFSLGVPLEKTWSCYRGANLPCGKCDSCLYRAKGFREAGMKDRTVPSVARDKIHPNRQRQAEF